MNKALAFCLFLVGWVGCGGNGVGPSDMATSNDSGGHLGGPLQCTTYANAASIRSLRDPSMATHASGCVALSNVIVVGRTSVQIKPRLYIQDAGGGDYSALMAKCGPNDGHACLTVSAVMQAVAGQVVTLQGYYTVGKTSMFEEFNVEQLTLTGQTGTLPPPVPVTLADLGRGGALAKTWFQKVTTTMPTGNPLVMYDFTPAELKTASGQCPMLLGFAMIPQASTAAMPAAAGCSGTTNPTSKAGSPDEILVNRFFYGSFNWHTDCGCQPAGSPKILLKPSATIPAGSTISGILSYEINKNNPGAGYQEFIPTDMNEFPIAN